MIRKITTTSSTTIKIVIVIMTIAITITNNNYNNNDNDNNNDIEKSDLKAGTEALIFGWIIERTMTWCCVVG